jgi:hypothetical protein
MIDLTGKMVSQIKNAYFPAGKSHINWTRDERIKQGVYFAVLQSQEY